VGELKSEKMGIIKTNKAQAVETVVLLEKCYRYDYWEFGFFEGYIK
jgi:hypothetical protein